MYQQQDVHVPPAATISCPPVPPAATISCPPVPPAATISCPPVKKNKSRASKFDAIDGIIYAKYGRLIQRGDIIAPRQEVRTCITFIYYNI